MELVIEATDESGPCGLPAISVAHYGEQNGDLMRDPEMCFELGLAGGRAPQPVLLAQRLRRRRAVVAATSYDDHYVFHVELHEQHEQFAKTWDNNLRLQGFAEAFTDKCIRG